jgi:hypothetical protein
MLPAMHRVVVRCVQLCFDSELLMQAQRLTSPTRR